MSKPGLVVGAVFRAASLRNWVPMILMTLAGGLGAQGIQGEAEVPEWKLEDGLDLRNWAFQPGRDVGDPPKSGDWATVTVPFLWAGAGINSVAKQKIARQQPWAKDTEQLSKANSGWFECRVTIPEEWAGERIWLRFNQIECDAIVFVDGKKVEFLKGPEGRVDLTDHVEPGKQATLRVWVTRWWEGTPERRVDDPLRSLALERNLRQWQGNAETQRRHVPAGISGRISFEIRPLIAEVTGVFVRPSVREKVLGVDVRVRGVAELTDGTYLRIRVEDPSGEGGMLPEGVDVLLETDHAGLQTIRIPWDDPRLWEIGDGYLYNLSVELVDEGGEVIHDAPGTRFGFREVWIEGRELVLNGHPLRLKLAPVLRPTWPAILFYEGMGFNAFELQPNITSWFVTWGRRPVIFASAEDNPFWEMRGITEETLTKMDERGLALMMPAPGLSNIRDGLLTPQARRAYARECDLWFARLANHPSILMWVPSMNTGSVTRENPERIGQDPQNYATVPSWYEASEKIIKSKDPTRLVVHHCGITGEMDFPNQYLNFSPLQERLEFPSKWARDGVKPWGAAEHGTPYLGNFSKWHGIPRFTEYFAAYLGDAAYAQEKPEYLAMTDQVARTGLAWRNLLPFHPKEFARLGDVTAYYEYDKLFTRNTNRYWRAWGVPGGWWPWMFHVGFGVPSNRGMDNPPEGFFYEGLTEAEAEATLDEAPEWANPIYHTYRETMQPLLAFIGGNPDHFTEQTDSFYSGEDITKSVILVWDGRNRSRFSVEWEFVLGGAVLAQSKESLDLDPGEIRKIPIKLEAPNVTAREDGILKLSVSDLDGKVQRDELKLAIWPTLGRREAKPTKWAVYDPAEKSLHWLRELGVDAIELKNAADWRMSDAEVLVLGRESIGSGALPFTVNDVSEGLRVLILEQRPADWMSLGLRVQDIVTRYVFPRDRQGSLFEGISDGDLINWRGAPDLVPPTSEGMEPHAAARPKHWGNEGAVASVVLETPQRGAFTALADAEFDLAFAPLLEWRHGNGGIMLSSFDFTDRIGSDPVATRLASNLIDALDQPYTDPQNREIAYIGNEIGWDYVRGLGFACQQVGDREVASLDPGTTLLVIGPDSVASMPGNLGSWVASGGRILVLAQSAEAFAEATLPLTLNVQEAIRSSTVPAADEPLLRGIGPQLLHWRTEVPQNLFQSDQLPDSATLLLDGLLLEVAEGDGMWVFSQLDWTAFDDQSWNLEPTRWNTMKFYRQLFTNLGAVSQTNLAETLITPRRSAPMASIEAWKVWNAVETVQATPQAVLDGLTTPLAAEQATVDETSDVDPTSPTEESAVVVGTVEANVMRADSRGEWTTLRPTPDGLVHLDWISPPGLGKIGYARTFLYSSRKREATFALGGDYWMVFRVNGKAYIDNTATPRPKHAPFSGEYQVTAPLEQGWNLLEVKVASGMDGFGFWCSVSDPGDLAAKATLQTPAEETPREQANLLPEPDLRREMQFYQRPLDAEDDPYSFFPW